MVKLSQQALQLKKSRTERRLDISKQNDITKSDEKIAKLQAQLRDAEKQEELARKEQEEWMLAKRFYERGIAPTQVQAGSPSIASKLRQLYQMESNEQQGLFRGLQEKVEKGELAKVKVQDKIVQGIVIGKEFVTEQNVSVVSQSTLDELNKRADAGDEDAERLLQNTSFHTFDAQKIIEDAVTEQKEKLAEKEYYLDAVPIDEKGRKGEFFPTEYVTMPETKFTKAGQNLIKAKDYAKEKILFFGNWFINKDALADKTFLGGGIINEGDLLKQAESGIGVGVISPVKMQSDDVVLKDAQAGYSQDIDRISQEIILKDATDTGLKKSLDEKYQDRYQTQFERRYAEDIIRGNITFKEASAKFEQSSEAKQIQKSYDREFNIRRAGKVTKAGAKVYGLQLSKGLVNIIPSTVGGTIITAGAVYGGVKAYKLFPTAQISKTVSIGLGDVLSAGFGTKGVIDVFDPKASPEKKVGGIVTAVLSGAYLGSKALRYLREPTIKTKAIDVPKKIEDRLQKGLVSKIEKNVVTDLSGKTTTITKYKTAKVTETIIKGRRTVINTKWRDALRMKPLYEGVPQQTPSTTYVARGLRSTTQFTLSAGETDYEKALKLLEKRLKLSSYQAENILRYKAPKVIYQDYSANAQTFSGELFEQQKVLIKGTNIIRQPSIVVDEVLGIKTRGATTIKESVSGKGLQIGTVKGRTVYDVVFNIEKSYIKDGLNFQKLTQGGKTTRQLRQFIISQDKGMRDVLIKDNFGLIKDRYGVYQGSDVQITSTVRVKDVIENAYARQTIPLKKELIRQRTETVIGKNKDVPTIEIDMGEFSPIRIDASEFGKPPKPPVEVVKLRTVKQWNALVDTLRDIYGTESPKVLPIKTDATGQITSQVTNQIKQVTELKTALQPINSLDAIKVKLNTLDVSNVAVSNAEKLATASISALQLKDDVRSKNRFNAKLKSALNTKQLQSELEKVAQTEKSVFNQAQTVKTIQKPALKLETVLEPIRVKVTPNDLPPPQLPKFTTPPISFGFNFPTQKVRKKIKQTKREREIYALMPDFTTRALGLKQEILTEKQARKRLKQLMTGLEIRRGARLKK